MRTPDLGVGWRPAADPPLLRWAQLPQPPTQGRHLPSLFNKRLVSTYCVPRWEHQRHKEQGRPELSVQLGTWTCPWVLGALALGALGQLGGRGRGPPCLGLGVNS